MGKTKQPTAAYAAYKEIKSYERLTRKRKAKEMKEHHILHRSAGDVLRKSEVGKEMFEKIPKSVVNHVMEFVGKTGVEHYKKIRPKKKYTDTS